jgi:two-component sensor histidine kinase
MLPYLERLGVALAASMIRDARPITLKVVGVAGSLSARQAESVGLIATELVMNALKHAFFDQNMTGRINVAYDVEGTNWKLSVADNGIGKPDGVFAQTKTGLGTGIIGSVRHFCRHCDTDTKRSDGPRSRHSAHVTIGA